MTDAEKEIERIKRLTATSELIKGGFAGIDKQGKIVDIRLFPNAVPIKAH